MKKAITIIVILVIIILGLIAVRAYRNRLANQQQPEPTSENFEENSLTPEDRQIPEETFNPPLEETPTENLGDSDPETVFDEVKTQIDDNTDFDVLTDQLIKLDLSGTDVDLTVIDTEF